MWSRKGLATATGGKLTTFRLLAWDALESVKRYLPGKLRGKGSPVFPAYQIPESMQHEYQPHVCRRLFGRYGEDASNLVAKSDAGLMTEVPGTDVVKGVIVQKKSPGGGRKSIKSYM